MIILLADDERMVRLGLKSMLDELYPSMHTYIEAKNGQELVELASLHKPHIAFVDIRMPLLDGLAAIEKCKAASPLTQWLMLTGYSDFNYAKEAIRLGVSDYLLKPVSVQELESAVEKVTQNITKHFSNLSHSFALEMLLSYNASLIGDTVETSNFKSKSSDIFEVYIFYIDTWDKNIRYALLAMLNNSLKTFCSNILDSDFRYALFYLSSGELCLVTCNSKKTVSLYALLTDTLNTAPKPITVFYGKYSSMQETCDACQKIPELTHIRLVHKLGIIIDYQELLQTKDLKIMSELSASLEKLCLAFIQGEELEYKNIINELYKNTSFKQFFLAINAANLERYLNAAVDLTLSIRDYKSLLDELLTRRGDMYRHQPKKSNTDIISQIENYIKENYMKEIGINSIAEMYDITPNYLSKIFHQKVGKKFIDYLTEVRITNAKRLFSEAPNITIKEVSVLVGYYSTRHFTKMFSKLVGCLPSEYQKNLS